MKSSVQTRKIVKIDPDKCNGCGLCVPSCAEGAIKIVNGKAQLRAENLCDGLGACLGECPQGAITIEERPAEAFDEHAVEQHKKVDAPATQCPSHAVAGNAQDGPAVPHGCPGSMMRMLNQRAPIAAVPAAASAAPQVSQLNHWPVQLTLLPTGGPIWKDADVLIAADCVAFAMPDFQQRLLAGKSLAIACPKLDDVSPYVQKLATIFANNTVKSITVAHMEVPCCTGIVRVVRAALEQSGRADIPVRDVTVGINGTILWDR